MNQEIGSMYAMIREQQGFSQEQVSDFLGITVEKLDAFENNKARIGVSDLEKSCDLFGCTLFMMMGQEEMNLLPKVSGTYYLNAESMEALCSMNRIALNLRKMNSIAK